MGKYVNFMAKIDFSTTKNEGYSVVNPFSYAYNTSRTVQPYEEDGGYHFYKKDSKYLYNVLNELAETGKESKSNDFNALLNLNIKLYDGLSYQGTFSYHNSSTNQRDWKTEESSSVASIRTYITSNMMKMMMNIGSLLYHTEVFWNRETRRKQAIR